MVRPVTVAFGHKAKITCFAYCNFPIVESTVASLSVDGTINVWSIIDGINIRHFENLLPDGCQKLAISPTVIQTAAVSGSFPLIYLVNLQVGQIIRTLHVCCKYIISLSFYTTDTNEWLFSMDADGNANYTSLTTAAGKSTRINLFNSSRRTNNELKPVEYFDITSRIVLSAIPNDSFSYLLVITDAGFAIISLTYPDLPIHYKKYLNISQGIWLEDNVIALLEYNGSVAIYNIPFNDGTCTHAEIIIKQCEAEKNLKKDRMKQEYLFTALPEYNKSNLNSYRDVMLSHLDPMRNSGSNSEFVPKRSVSIPNQTFLQNKNLKKWDFSQNEKYEMSICAPIISSWHGRVVLATKETLIIDNIGQNGFNFKMSDVFSKASSKKAVTSQCYILKDKEVVGIAEGTVSGKIKIRGICQDTEVKETAQRHRGKVTSLMSTKRYLFSSGKDCMVYAHSLEDFTLKKEFAHFVEPVSDLYRISNTDTTFDHCILCITKGGKAALIDLTSLQCLFIFAGHDSSIKNVFYHPPTKMFLIECRSLYFWSAKTGNLESVMIGNQKEFYLNACKSTFKKFMPVNTTKLGIRYVQHRFGNMLLTIPSIDIKDICREIVKVFEFNRDKDETQILKIIPNLPLISVLLSKKSNKHLKSVNNFEYKSQFQLAFIGACDTPTIYLPGTKMSHKAQWQLSPMVTTLLLSMRAVLCLSMGIHPKLSQSFHKFDRSTPLSFDNKVKDFQPPSLYYLFHFIGNCSQEVHAYLFKIIEEYPEDIRLKWTKSLLESFRLFPYHKQTLILVYSAISSTLLNILKPDELEVAVDYMMSLYATEQNENGKFVREILAAGMEKFKPFLEKEFKPLIIKTANDCNPLTLKDCSIDRYISNFPNVCFQILNEILTTQDQNSKILAFRHFGRAMVKYGNARHEIAYNATVKVISKSHNIPFPYLTEVLTKMSDSLKWFKYVPGFHILALSTYSGKIKCFSRLENMISTAEAQISTGSVEDVAIDEMSRFVFGYAKEESQIVCLCILSTTEMEEKNKKKTLVTHLKLKKLLRKDVACCSKLEWKNSTVLQAIGESGIIEEFDLEKDPFASAQSSNK